MLKNNGVMVLNRSDKVLFDNYLRLRKTLETSLDSQNVGDKYKRFKTKLLFKNSLST